MADIQFFSCDNGLSDICFRMLDGFSHGIAFGKIGGNSGREGASRSMQIMAFYFFLLWKYHNEYKLFCRQALA